MKTWHIIPLILVALLLGAALFALAETNEPVVLNASMRESHAGDLALTEVILSKDSTTIGPRAFAGCKNLRSVYIPLHLSDIAENAFEGCEDLTLYGYKNEMWMYPNEHGLKYVDLTRVSPDGLAYAVDFEDGSCAITGYRGEPEDLDIPEEIDGHRVIEINEYAFNECMTLKTVKVPGSVRSIGRCVFQDCDALTEVTLSEGLESLGDWTFNYCSMETLSLPASLTTVGENPVRGCYNLTAINVDEENANYRSVDGVLYDAALTRSISCPCGKTGSVSIPFGVSIIGNSTFVDCCDISYIEIPVTVTAIENYAFQECRSLETISLPVSVEMIEGNPFRECDNLARIEVSPDNPNFMTIDGVLYSSDMKRLIWAPMNAAGRFAIPDGVVMLEEDAFFGAKYEEIYIPASVTDIKYTALNNNEFERILVSEDNPKYSASDGILYNKEMTEIITVPSAKKGQVVVPDGVAELGTNVFSDCDYITEIILPEGLVSIGHQAFQGDGKLVSIRIPSTVNTIMRRAFSYCSSLETVTLPEGIEAIMQETFKGCESLCHIDLPSTLRTIDEDAFYECESLYDMTIPTGVTYIHPRAFRECDNLTLHGETGSYAEQFAVENDIPFTTNPEPDPGTKPEPDQGMNPEPDETLAEYQTLQKGSKGVAVETLQRELISLGFLNGKADGDYGNMTAAAVSAFQQSVSLPETGVADEETQRLLFGE